MICLHCPKPGLRIMLLTQKLVLKGILFIEEIEVLKRKVGDLEFTL